MLFAQQTLEQRQGLLGFVFPLLNLKHAAFSCLFHRSRFGGGAPVWRKQSVGQERLSGNVDRQDFGLRILLFHAFIHSLWTGIVGNAPTLGATQRCRRDHSFSSRGEIMAHGFHRTRFRYTHLLESLGTDPSLQSDGCERFMGLAYGGTCLYLCNTPGEDACILKAFCAQFVYSLPHLY